MISAKHSDQPRVGATAKRKILTAKSGSPKRVTISGKAAGHDTLRGVRQKKRSPTMKTMAGLWIDRRKAVIVLITAQGDTISEIHSNVEHRPSRSVGVQSTTAHESLLVKSDDRLQRVFTGHIKRFYDKVINAIADADAVLILGPGEAKGELLKQLNLAVSEKRMIAVEPSGAMSNRQMMAKIHEHFQL